MNAKVLLSAIVAVGGVILLSEVAANSGAGEEAAGWGGGAGGGSDQIGPDVTVLHVGGRPGADDMLYYGEFGGVGAYALATVSCNEGDMGVNWYANEPRHPVITQNMFRIKDGRFEQIGLCWPKHGFCAINETGCGTCQATDCDTLGIGCADTYWASLNGRRGHLGPHSEVDPVTGTHIEPHGSPVGDEPIRGRLQVQLSDLEPGNPDVLYFIDSQYLTEDDVAWGNEDNSTSWRKVLVETDLNLSSDGPTVMHDPAIFAWPQHEPGVVLSIIDVPDDGRFILGSKVTQMSGDLFRYDYALMNYNSDRAAQSFAVDTPPDTAVSDLEFRDVDYHSGEIYDITDWPGTFDGTACSWTTEPFGQNPDANALRWSTTYSYSFIARAVPGNGDATITFFKPGANPTAVIGAWVPAEPDVALPLDFLVVFGSYESGAVEDLHFSDDSYLSIEQRPAFSPLLPLIRVEVESSTSLPAPAEFSFVFEASVEALPANSLQRVALRNYDANAWETVDERLGTPSDSVVTIVIGTDPARFVEDVSGKVEARAEWFNPGNVVFPNWDANVDQAVWRFTP